MSKCLDFRYKVLVNNERVGSESIIHVAGPDPKQCMVDGPGYSTAKALPMILHHDSPTN